MRHQQEPYETEINEEVEKEYEWLQEGKRCTLPHHDKDIAEFGKRMDKMEAKMDASNVRFEVKIDASSKRLEAMFMPLLTERKRSVHTALS